MIAAARDIWLLALFVGLPVIALVAIMAVLAGRRRWNDSQR